MSCNDKSGWLLARVLSVTESSRCRYEHELVKRFLCHELAALVYPRLANDDLRHEWDLIVTQLDGNHINKTI